MPGASTLLVSIEINQECPLNCPFCYSTPRRRGCRWEPSRLLGLISEAVRLHPRVAVVLGDGEPLLSPGLTARALRHALEEGAVQVGLTTSGTPRGGLERLTVLLGEPLHSPEGSITVSLDHYKAVAQPRCTPSSARLASAWGNIHELIGGSPRPPELVCTVEDAHRHGWSVVVNLLVTWKAPHLLPLLLAIVGEGLVEQVNLLAPKPLRPLAGPGIAPVAARIARILGREGVRLAVDASMRQLLTGKPGCEAGRLLLSVDACGMVRPCSFSSHGLPWMPGMLRALWAGIERHASEARRGWCPFLGLSPSGGGRGVG